MCYTMFAKVKPMQT